MEQNKYLINVIYIFSRTKKQAEEDSDPSAGIYVAQSHHSHPPVHRRSWTQSLERTSAELLRFHHIGSIGNLPALQKACGRSVTSSAHLAWRLGSQRI